MADRVLTMIYCVADFCTEFMFHHQLQLSSEIDRFDLVLAASTTQTLMRYIK